MAYKILEFFMQWLCFKIYKYGNFFYGQHFKHHQLKILMWLEFPVPLAIIYFLADLKILNNLCLRYTVQQYQLVQQLVNVTIGGVSFVMPGVQMYQSTILKLSLFMVRESLQHLALLENKYLDVTLIRQQRF